MQECLYENTAIGKYQAAHTPLKPLAGMNIPKQQKVLKDICKLIGE